MRNTLTNLTFHEVNKIDLSSFTHLSNGTDINMKDILEPAGVEHYKFLYWLSQQFHNSHIIDIGTHTGGSGSILAANPTNMVYSFDVVKKGNLPILPNLVYYLQDLTDAHTLVMWEQKILSSSFIFLDIDPHEGTREYKFYEWLKSKAYKGFLVCDDVVLFPAMREHFWDKIPQAEKIEITHLGHHSGTGIVFFQ